MIAVLIDGGHVRTLARKAKKKYNPDFIEKFGRKCAQEGERIQRILYYDCAPFRGSKPLPVSGKEHRFEWSNDWLHDLAQRDLFAVRLGVLKFRGWVPIRTPPREDKDFKPDFEQKGVDMRIGLDMAHYAQTRSVERIGLVTNDTDCIPAMKYARRAGIQIVLICVPGYTPAPELLAHCDFKREIEWP